MIGGIEGSYERTDACAPSVFVRNGKDGYIDPDGNRIEFIAHDPNAADTTPSG